MDPREPFCIMSDQKKIRDGCDKHGLGRQSTTLTENPDTSVAPCEECGELFPRELFSWSSGKQVCSFCLAELEICGCSD